MATKYERIQFSPSDEAEKAITDFIAEMYQNHMLRLTRTDALNHLVNLGIRVRKHGKQIYQQLLNEIEDARKL